MNKIKHNPIWNSLYGLRYKITSTDRISISCCCFLSKACTFAIMFMSESMYNPKKYHHVLKTGNAILKPWTVAEYSTEDRNRLLILVSADTMRSSTFSVIRRLAKLTCKHRRVMSLRISLHRERVIYSKIFSPCSISRQTLGSHTS